MSSENLIFAGGVNRRPSGGLKTSMFGSGIGIGIFFVIGSRIVITVIFFDNPSRLKLSDSTFVAQSMLTLKAGCGIGMRTSGPK